jgi:malate synthase
MLRTLELPMTDRLLTPAFSALVGDLDERFGSRRQEVLAINAHRREILRSGSVASLPETEAVRKGGWEVDPVPAELLERRVELLGGANRRELIDGLNAGAKSYVADLWNLTLNEPKTILQVHKNIERAATNRLAYVNAHGDRVRINPGSITRLMIVPRPLPVEDLTLGKPVPASFFDLAMHALNNAESLRLRQGGIFLYLRNVGGHHEAKLWNDLFAFLEEKLELPQGSFRATVIMDSLAGVLEADEILYELRHRSAGLSLDPQAYAADHLELFNGPDLPIFPDRQHIGLNARFLRSVSLRTISICHRRQAHAIGAPSFILPPDVHGHIKAEYLEMIADKEREAVDGHDGTLVGHPGLVNAAMAEFNKSMPRGHQMYFQRPDTSSPADLTAPPEGALTTEGLLRCVRTLLQAMVCRTLGKGPIVQGGRIHDRSSVRLASMLLWHWTRSPICFISDTGLEVHADVVKYLIRKEGAKLFPPTEAALHSCALDAAKLLTGMAMAPEVPPDLMGA